MDIPIWPPVYLDPPVQYIFGKISQPPSLLLKPLPLPFKSLKTIHYKIFQWSWCHEGLVTSHMPVREDLDFLPQFSPSCRHWGPQKEFFFTSVPVIILIAKSNWPLFCEVIRIYWNILKGSPCLSRIPHSLFSENFTISSLNLIH